MRVSPSLQKQRTCPPGNPTLSPCPARRQHPPGRRPYLPKRGAVPQGGKFIGRVISLPNKTPALSAWVSFGYRH